MPTMFKCVCPVLLIFMMLLLPGTKCNDMLQLGKNTCDTDVDNLETLPGTGSDMGRNCQPTTEDKKYIVPGDVNTKHCELMSVENKINDLEVSLANVSVNMRIFSLCMRTLYAKKVLRESSSDTTRKINKIRDDTRKDALVYVKGILPASTELIRTIQEFFDYYETLSFEEWNEHLPDILNKVRGYKQCFVEIIKLHEQITIPFKTREEEAKVILEEMIYLTGELERKKAYLNRYTSAKEILENLLNMFPGFLPNINVIEQFISLIADFIMAQTKEETDAQFENNNAVVVVLSEAMIPALAEFTKGLRSISSFFTVVEQEIIIFQESEKDDTDSIKKLHYKILKSRAKKIKQRCTQFFAVIPGVRTDILCIPLSGSDMNDVDKWLKAQQEKIKRTYGPSLSGQLKKMLTHLSTEEGEKIINK